MASLSDRIEENKTELQTLKMRLELEEQIRTAPVEWERLAKAFMLSPHDVADLNQLERAKSAGDVVDIIGQSPGAYIKAFAMVLSANAQNPAALRKTLLALDTAMSMNPAFRDALIEYQNTLPQPYHNFRLLLNRDDAVVVQYASKILSTLLRFDRVLRLEIVESFLQWIIAELRSTDPSRVARATGALMNVMRREDYQTSFYHLRGHDPLFNCLDSVYQHYQPTYQALYCMWLLTYNPEFIRAWETYNIIPKLHSYLRNSKKEKIIRMSLFIMQNLCDRERDLSGSYHYFVEMTNLGVDFTLEKLERRSFSDADIVEAIGPLRKLLATEHPVITSFDDYRQEVLSGHLEQSPLHNSEKFWRQNMAKFEGGDFFILRELKNLMEHSNVDEQTLSLALLDIGNYIRYNQRGRKIIEDLGFKIVVMKLLNHPNEEVARGALLCMQKMLIKNWEFLARER